MQELQTRHGGFLGSIDRSGESGTGQAHQQPIQAGRLAAVEQAAVLAAHARYHFPDSASFGGAPDLPGRKAGPEPPAAPFDRQGAQVKERRK